MLKTMNPPTNVLASFIYMYWMKNVLFATTTFVIKHFLLSEINKFELSLVDRFIRGNMMERKECKTVVNSLTQ